MGLPLLNLAHSSQIVSQPLALQCLMCALEPPIKIAATAEVTALSKKRSWTAQTGVQGKISYPPAPKFPTVMARPCAPEPIGLGVTRLLSALNHLKIILEGGLWPAVEYYFLYRSLYFLNAPPGRQKPLPSP